MTLFFTKHRKYVGGKNLITERRWVVYEFTTVRGVMRLVGKVKVARARPDKTPKVPMSGDVRPGQIGTLASATGSRDIAKARLAPGRVRPAER